MACTNRLNLAGLDFGNDPWGTWSPGSSQAPPASQIKHFTSQGVNVIRVPVAWEFIQKQLNGDIEQEAFNKLDGVVKAVTGAGAWCLIDLHSYARFKGQVVGQSSVPNAALSDLWTKLAKPYKSNSKVIIGLMNEPHDLDLNKWANTVQEVVTALRKQDIQNPILIPGSEWSSFAAFSKTYEALKGVKNLDGSFEGILFDFHRYLDATGAGQNAECVSNRVDEVKAVVQVLAQDNRQAMVTETGGINSPTCARLVAEFSQALVDSYPHILGATLWAAGSFPESYELVLTKPKGQDQWEDTSTWKAVQKFLPGSTKKSCKAARAARRVAGETKP